MNLEEKCKQLNENFMNKTILTVHTNHFGANTYLQHISKFSILGKNIVCHSKYFMILKTDQFEGFSIYCIDGSISANTVNDIDNNNFVEIDSEIVAILKNNIKNVIKDLMEVFIKNPKGLKIVDKV